MSVIESQNKIHTRIEERYSDSFNRLPADIVGKIVEFFPRNYGALPRVNWQWNRGFQRVKARFFLRKDKENLDLIVVFRTLSMHSRRVKNYLSEHPITEDSLVYKQDVQRIANEIQTWIQTQPHYWQSDYFSFSLDLSNKNLTTLPLVASVDCREINLSHNRFTDLEFMKQLPSNLDAVTFDSNPLSPSIKGTLFLQKTLLVLSTLAAILCIIPPLRTVGSLLLRSLSCISSTLIAKKSIESDDRATCLLKCIKVSTAILAIIGFVLGQPLLLLVALSLDIALELIDSIRGAIEGNMIKCLMNLGFIALNTLILAALATGLWQILVAATALSALLMVIMVFYSAFNRSYLESFCNIILIGVGITASVLSSQINYTDSYHYEYTNRTSEKVRLIDFKGPGGHEWYVNPGETIQLDLPVGYIREQLPSGSILSYHLLNPVSSHQRMIQEPIPFPDFPTVPVGSPFIENTFIAFRPWVR